MGETKAWQFLAPTRCLSSSTSTSQATLVEIYRPNSSGQPEALKSKPQRNLEPGCIGVHSPNSKGHVKEWKCVNSSRGGKAWHESGSHVIGGPHRSVVFQDRILRGHI